MLLNNMLAQVLYSLGDGGGLYFSRDNLNILVLDCEFSNNAALGTIDENKALGGGVAIWSNNVFLTFQASLFKNNTGVRGGGIGVYDINLNLHIRSCIFEDNHAYVNGGGIYLIFDNTHLIVEGSLFKRNTAEYGIVTTLKYHLMTIACAQVVLYVFGPVIIMFNSFTTFLIAMKQLSEVVLFMFMEIISSWTFTTAHS